MVDKKKVLLIAYAFPPLWEAQSVRWYYLSRELAKAGIKVDVLTVDYPGEAENFPGIRIFRTFPGLFSKLIFKVTAHPSLLSSKVRSSKGFFLLKKIYRFFRRLATYFLLGDLRNEWFIIGYCKALRMLKTEKYDFLITSHEPMVDAILGLAIKNKTKIKWIADLADPISANYYPSFWKPILRKIEEKVVKKADVLIVTNDVLKRKYEKIRGCGDKILVISQGFDLDFFKKQEKRDKNQKFTLSYTGSFYREFRDPKCLIEALKKLNFEFELYLAGRLEEFLPSFREINGKVKYLGVLSHKEVLELQANSDVLIYLGNKLEDQVPGKFFEYLGSKRPILCIAQNKGDPIKNIVKTLSVGECCSNEVDEIYKTIKKFYEMWVNNELNLKYCNEEGKIRDFSWQNQTQKLLDFLKKI